MLMHLKYRKLLLYPTALLLLTASTVSAIHMHAAPEIHQVAVAEDSDAHHGPHLCHFCILVCQAVAVHPVTVAATSGSHHHVFPTPPARPAAPHLTSHQSRAPPF